MSAVSRHKRRLKAEREGFVPTPSRMSKDEREQLHLLILAAEDLGWELTGTMFGGVFISGARAEDLRPETRFRLVKTLGNAHTLVASQDLEASL